MSALSGFPGDFPKRLRKLSPRNTIAVPVVAILLLITLGIFTAGYYINKSVFYTVFEEREGNKARNIHRIIESIVSTEIKRISSFAKILKNDTDIVYAVYHYNGTRGDVKPLKAAMDQLYPKMNLPVFLMADAGGKVLYQAGKKTEPGFPSLAETPAFHRALRGELVITAGGGPGVTGIWAIVPIRGFEKGRPKAVLVLGSRIDGPFARKLAQDTGSQVFLATSERVIADSYEGGDTRTFDPSLAQSSLAGQKPVFHVDRKSYRSYTYVPLKIMDDQFCLVIETDISVIQDLLARNRTKMAEWGGILLVGITLLGVGFTLHLIWPLKQLHRKAQQVIREYSGPRLEPAPQGNEISTLVHANDLMLETIKNHLAERTRAERALRETSRTLHALIDASPLAVVVSDASGTVRVWNPAAVRMFGWREEETIDRPNPLLSAEANPALRAACGSVLRGERLSNVEILGKDRGGSEIFLAFSGAPLFDGQGAAVAMMAILADITDARKDQEALRKSQDQLRQSQKMEAVGKLAGGIAHDFNNLLSVITGYSEILLLRLEGRDPMRREIGEIHKAGERAASLTRQLLAFSRRQVLKPKRLRMNEVVENIGNMLRRLIGEHIEFVTEAQEDLWSVRADPSQIEQILMNLTINARDAMPKGGKLVISTANVRMERPFVDRELTIPPGRYATLQVSDDGCGMEEAILDRIFEPFFSTKDPGKGTGLGLSTVYGIVKQSNGYIHVDSAPGRGTAVTVYFPEDTAEERDAEREAPGVPDLKLSRTGTLLLVEDEPMVRELAVEILQQCGFHVLEAENGDMALAICGRYDRGIDLLVTDLAMPGMNGIELARRVGDTRPGTPVLFMSGYAEDAVGQLGDMDKGWHFLQKPISPTILSRKLREIFPGQEAATQV